MIFLVEVGKKSENQNDLQFYKNDNDFSLGKVHITPSNCNTIDNVLPNFQFEQCLPPPQKKKKKLLKIVSALNDKNTLNKIK
jgi:hypothetical protein